MPCSGTSGRASTGGSRRGGRIVDHQYFRRGRVQRGDGLQGPRQILRSLARTNRDSRWRNYLARVRAEVVVDRPPPAAPDDRSVERAPGFRHVQPTTRNRRMELGHWHAAAPDDDERLAICGVDRRAGRKIFEVELDDRRGHGSAELQSGCHDVYFGPPHPMQFSYEAQEAALLSALRVAPGPRGHASPNRAAPRGLDRRGIETEGTRGIR